VGSASAHRPLSALRSPTRARAHAFASSSSPLAAVELPVGDGFVRKLTELKSAGAASSFNSLKVAPRLVSQAELMRVTKLDPQLLLGGSQTDFKWLLIATVVGSSVLGLGAQAMTFLREDLRFALTYGLALFPILLLAIGSTAPGLLELPAKMLAGKGGESAERAARHEAAHLLLGYCFGLELESFSLEKGREAVAFTGESAGPLELEKAQALLVVAMGGMIGEYLAFGDAEGGRQDLAEMQTILTRVYPRLSPAEQQGYTRWAALMSWSYLKSMTKQLDATTAALQSGASLSEVLGAIEGAATAK
jgi:hypothetical protein